MIKGSRINRLARPVASLVFVAVIGHLTAAGVEVHAAPPSSHEDILNSVVGVQTTVNSIETKIDSIKAKLDLIPPAWSQILPVADRFQLVMGGAAVLDKETGLVWEQSPETTLKSWSFAQFTCNRRTVGGRLGWRLPTLQELASLIDPSNLDGNPDLPPGHPFSNVESDIYWSGTTEYLGLDSHADTDHVWLVFFNSGTVDNAGNKVFDTHRAWCVRGGQGVDPQ